MSQLNKGETFTNVTPGKTLTSTRLNNHVDGATLLNGAVIDQSDVSTRAGNVVPLAADTVLLGDSTNPNTAVPLKVRLDGLLLETQRSGVIQYQGTDTGAANAYVVALAPAATAYAGGMVVRFKAANANTGASTIAVNGLAAKTIKTRKGDDLAANDILANQVCELVYDGTYFQLTPAISAGEVTATHAAENFRMGINQYAADTGAADAYACAPTPAATAYTAGMVVRFKAANANTGAATLNVNALGVKTIKRVVAGAVADLLARDIQAADLVTAVYDGTYFILTGRVRSWDYVSAATNAGAAGAVVAFAHGLGAVPNKVRVVLVQTDGTARNGYAQNDETPIESLASNTTGMPAFGLAVDATNVTVIRTNGGSVYQFPKTGGATVDIASFVNTANFYFKLKVYASL